MRKKLSMRKTREIFRLHASGLKQRQIARSLNVGVGSINKYLHLAKKADIQWPFPEEWDEETLRGILFSKTFSPPCKKYQAPDCEWIHQELKHKGVTLQLLHQEYRARYSERSYKYTQFCEIYRRWKKSRKLSMRQEHTFGEWDQKLPQWLGSYTRALCFFGGVPKLLVPDNLRTGVSHACRYDPDLHPAYADMAAYYNTAILPARPYKPKDKPQVENGVLIVSRWILARLRHQTFYSLEELNKAITGLLEELNRKPFQKKSGSRYSQFMEFEKPALNPLPARPYSYAQFKCLRAGFDYHVEIDKHYYSVPYQYARQEVEIRLSAHVVWSPEACLKWASEIDPATHTFIRYILKHKRHIRQVYRLFLGLRRYFGSARLEKACQRAVFYERYSYKSLFAFLEKRLDQEPLPDHPPEVEPLDHPNIRGAHYYR